MSTLYITHPICHRHEMGAWHPESPQRLDAINDQLLASGVQPYLFECTAHPASVQDLLRVHTQEYLDSLKTKKPDDGYCPIDGDTFLNPYTLEAANYSAGAGLTALDEIMHGQANNAFCAIRPPGHHAMPNQAMGFCFFNNLAITAKYAVEKYQFKKIAVIDFDVHHGNGTEAALSDDPHVMMFSFFQHSVFPYTGTESPAPNMFNSPVDAYADTQVVRDIITNDWLPRLHAYQPELILISAGFDAHKEDEMGQLKLVESDYAWITKQIIDVANRYARGRVISFLEGGYSLSALGRSVVAHIRVLADLD